MVYLDLEAIRFPLVENNQIDATFSNRQRVASKDLDM